MEMKEYTWKPEAKMSDVKLHAESLKAGIRYFENRKNRNEVAKLSDELKSLTKFYNLTNA